MTDAEEAPEHRLKRLRMRSMRRGMKEMDVILSGFAEAHLAGMDAERLALYDRLLWENDQEIFAWVLGREPAPEPYRDLIGEIAAHAGA